MATTTETPWQAQIVDQLGELDDDPDLTHAVVWIPGVANAEAQLFDRTVGKAAATVSAEDHSTKVAGGEVRVVELEELLAWHRDQRALAASDPEPEPEPEDPDHGPVRADGNANGNASGTVTTVTVDADSLFDPNAFDDPRLHLESKDGRRIDEIVIRFGGAITLRRLNHDDVQLYRDLKMGKEVEFVVSGKVTGDALTIKPASEKRREQLSGARTITIHSLDAGIEKE